VGQGKSDSGALLQWMLEARATRRFSLHAALRLVVMSATVLE